MINHKNQLRKEMIHKRNQIHNREKRSNQIIQKLMEMNEYKKANIVLAYSSIGSEVQTEHLFHYILRENKILYLPRVIDFQNAKMEFYRVDALEDLESGYQGIKEPLPVNSFCAKEQKSNVLIIVPGVAFDRNKMRMGYGMGYYDRYLEKIQMTQGNVSYIMLAYQEQEVSYIPYENTDIFMHEIITG